MTPSRLTISEVADLLRVPAKTIRHYHDIGVLPEPERGENGYRLYSPRDIRSIQRIRELQTYGLSLKQIRFVLQADEPDLQLRAFLIQHDTELTAEISRLQQQQARVRAALNSDLKQPIPTPGTAASEILRSAIQPVSNGLAEVLLEIESHTLAELDRLRRDDRTIRFWEDVAATFTRSVQPHEHMLIVWLERYLALPNMTHDDRQAQAWLQELRSTSFARVLLQAMALPESDALPVEEQLQIRRLLPILLFEQASPLQRAFIAALQQESKR